MQRGLRVPLLRQLRVDQLLQRTAGGLVLGAGELRAQGVDLLLLLLAPMRGAPGVRLGLLPRHEGLRLLLAIEVDLHAGSPREDDSEEHAVDRLMGWTVSPSGARGRSGYAGERGNPAGHLVTAFAVHPAAVGGGHDVDRVLTRRRVVGTRKEILPARLGLAVLEQRIRRSPRRQRVEGRQTDPAST